ncbi:MAG TPA: TIGR04282 family arsenosugar biosynthesis glycosyltransferase [Planctomycetota bacterium]|nr:TIGR04282 family arsenosugar biosynthesis glycosyltransferase [Planctomycetota bacterium]
MLLAVFAKAPEAGKVKTRLCPPLSPESAAVLYGAFLGDTLARLGAYARSRGIDLAVAHDGGEGFFRSRLPAGATLVPQRGAGLAERLVGFFEEGFGASPGPVVVVGSDSPTLPSDRLDGAFAALGAGRDAVICPDDGGGYCLIGLARPLPSLFEGVEMGTARVASQTRERAARAGVDLALLEPWYDVDTPRDLARLVSELQDPSVEAPATRAAFRSLARLPGPRMGEGPPALDMKGDWNLRARAAAQFFVASWASASEEEFAASGQRDFEHFFEGLESLLNPGAVVLDLGCGVGRMDAFVAPRVKRLIGLDVSEEMLARARARLRLLRNVSLLEGDGTTLAPVPEGSVDLVFSHIVFQHVPRRVFEGYLPEVRRVLRPGADFLFQVPEAVGGSPAEPPEEDTYTQRYFTEEQVRGRLETAHLEWVSCRRFRAGTEEFPIDHLRVHARR